MHLLLASETDPAGLNIQKSLLNRKVWKISGTYGQSPIYSHPSGKAVMATLEKNLLECDYIDTAFTESTGIAVSGVICLSRHESDSGKKSLTVHPIGNFHIAEHGGKPKSLVPAMPHVMTSALRYLKKHAAALCLPHAVSFEATHHGPYLEKPTFFIEIGSTFDEWNNVTAAECIASALLDTFKTTRTDNAPVGIGIGGGHYAPRVTDFVLSRNVSIGHIIPSYAINGISEEVLRQAKEKTTGAEFVFIHRKASDSDIVSSAEKSMNLLGLRTATENEFDAIGAMIDSPRNGNAL